MAAAMRGFGLVPDLVLVSSARRTLQTLEAMEPWDQTPAIEPLDALYLATAPDLLEAVQGASAKARCILLIGHNPGLHDLALLLAGASIGRSDAALRRITEGYPSGALAEFQVAGAWSGLRAGRWRTDPLPCPCGPVGGGCLNMAALEFCLPPEDATTLLRLPGLGRGARPVTSDRVWYDTADGVLTEAGLSVCEHKGMWRIERSRPAARELWPPGGPAPLLAEAASLEALGDARAGLPLPLMPVCGSGFRGRHRVVPASGTTLTVLEGTLRGVDAGAARLPGDHAGAACEPACGLEPGGGGRAAERAAMVACRRSRGFGAGRRAAAAP